MLTGYKDQDSWLSDDFRTERIFYHLGRAICGRTGETRCVSAAQDFIDVMFSVKHLCNEDVGGIIVDSIKGQSVVPIFVVGDSHVLSSAWKTVGYGGNATGGGSPVFRLHPTLVTGLKAHHVAYCTHIAQEADTTEEVLQIFGQAARINAHFLVERLQSARCLLDKAGAHKLKMPVIFMCGEIDCRWEEGILSAVHSGKFDSAEEGVETTVQCYVRALVDLTERFSLQAAVHCVPYPRAAVCPSVPLDKERLRLVGLFNKALRAHIRTPLYLIDIGDELLKAAREDEGLFLDAVHMAQEPYVSDYLEPALKPWLAQLQL
jgi:hypothetical protein